MFFLSAHDAEMSSSMIINLTAAVADSTSIGRRLITLKIDNAEEQFIGWNGVEEDN